MAEHSRKRDKVVVIGAGLAGLTAAIELRERGMQVEVLEKEAIAGGRVKSWRDADGDTIEHGLHKWYHQYRNYRALMQRVGCGRVLLAPRKADTLRLQSNHEIIFEFDHGLPSPLNFTPFVFKRLKSTPLIGRIAAGATLLIGCTFDRRKDYETTLDDLSVADYARRLLVEKTALQQLIDPLTVYMHALRADKASFAATMDGALFAVFGNRESFKIQGLKGGPGELVIDPMIAYLERLGGVLRLGAEVLDVETDDERARSITYRSDGSTRRIHCDYVVCAADIAGLQPVIRGSLAHHPMFARILELEPITVWVARVWLDRRIPITTQLISDFKLSFLIYNLSVFQKEFAKRKNETVLELIMPDVAPYEHLDDAQIREVALAELRQLFPEVAGANVRKWVLNKWQRTYTPHTVGSYRCFPERRTPLTNLFMAGDWVRCAEHPAVYQEKAVVTGQLAANEILIAEGLRGVGVIPPFDDDWTIKVLRLAANSLRRPGMTLREAIFSIAGRAGRRTVNEKIGRAA